MRLLPRLFLRHAFIFAWLLAFAAASSEGQATAQFPPDWTNALGSLADKIAAVTKRGEGLSLEAKNISSLSAADVDSLRQLLLTDLSRRNRRVVTESSADAALQVTFSESADGYVWIAQILGGDQENVVMVSVAAPNQKASTTEAPLTLHRKLIWEQDMKILDFGILGEGMAGGSSMLIVLGSDKLSFYGSQDKSWKLARTVDLAHGGTAQRDLRGRLDLKAGKAELPGAECGGDFQHPETVTCSSITTTADRETPRQPIGIQARSVEDYAVLAGACGDDSLMLASGAGDWTVPDFIQGYDGRNLSAATQQIQVPGPVLELLRNDDGKSARVVSRNLKTGVYEASIVSVSCDD
ncbi:MAG TPA: hypothetical protein VN875_09405 [Candidatus Binatus sp.]|jgi:hypothetical protein|nr:hypothetical protein [Candidatus Binatus sp.]